MSGTLALAVLLAALRFAGASTCPTVAEVVDRLTPLLPTDPAADEHRVTVTRTLAHVELTLDDTRGQRLAARRINAVGTCADLAAAAAVVIATWEVELRGQGQISGLEDVRLVVPFPPSSGAPDLWRLAVGLSLFGSGVLGTDPRPGVAALVQAGPAGGAWRGTASLFGVWPHRLGLDPGDVAWGRLGGGIGVAYEHTSGSLYRAAVAEALGAAMTLRGVGFDENRAFWTFDAGAALALRAGVETTRSVTWVGVTLVTWPFERELVVVGASSRRLLPRWEALLAVGIILRGKT